MSEGGRGEFKCKRDYCTYGRPPQVWLREFRTQPYTTFTTQRKADDGSADHAPICHKLGRPDHNSTSPSKFSSKPKAIFLVHFPHFFLIAKISSLAENEGFFFFRILPHLKMDAVCKTTPAGSGHAVIGDRNSNMQEGGRRPGWRIQGSPKSGPRV